MVQSLFLGMSLIGAEWVLWLLVLISVISVTVIIERALFYRQASRGLEEFRTRIRAAAESGKWDEAAKAARSRTQETNGSSLDLESGLASALLSRAQSGKARPEVLSEVAQDEVLRAKLVWDKNLAILATIGSNAPFVGLFGTVLGIIKAFHDLSIQSGAAAGAGATVTAGMAEALIATAVGILVAIPAVVAFNLFQRRVKYAVAQAEAMKSFLVGKLAE